MKRLIPFTLALIAFSDVSSQAFSNIDFQEMYYGCICGTVGSDEGFVPVMSNLGPEMDYIVTSLNGASEISVNDGTITFGVGENGSVAFTWDGADGDAITTSFNTVIAALGSCGDITINIDKPTGTVAMNFDLTVEMYNSATQFIAATTPVSITTGTQAVTLNTSVFQETGPAFDFNDVRAIRVIFSTMNGNGESVDISSLDWVPDVSTDPTCAPIADPNLAAGIPTMGEWGIIILGLSAAVIGLIFIRRKSSIFSAEIR